MREKNKTPRNPDLERSYQAMIRISQYIVSSEDSDHILDFLAKEIVEAGVFRSLMIATVERESVIVKCNVVYEGGIPGSGRKLKSETKDQKVIGTVYHIQDNNITAQAARTGKLQVIETWQADKLDQRFDASDKQWGDKVAFFVPIVFRGDVLAVLGSGCSKKEKDDMLARIDLLQPLWNQIAIALHSTGLGASQGQPKGKTTDVLIEKLATLTSRERQVLCLIAEGLATKEMADRLGVGEKTIETHRRNVRKKLDLQSIADLTIFAVQVGLVKV